MGKARERVVYGVGGGSQQFVQTGWGCQMDKMESLEEVGCGFLCFLFSGKDEKEKTAKVGRSSRADLLSVERFRVRDVRIDPHTAT